jgi:hypothetical protein
MDDLQSKMNELFSSPEGMEKIKNIVSMFGASGGGDGEEQKKEKENDSGDNGFNFDPALMLKLTQAFNVMQKGDPKIDLLVALKTNLSEPRRKKVDEAIQIMRLINMMPILKEQGFLFGDSK